MACILIEPTATRRGLLSITTSEVAQLSDFGNSEDMVRELKERYYLALHHNWHPASSQFSDIFDLHFLNARDCLFQVEPKGLLNLDACNFSPSSFTQEKLKAVWDVLIVGRNVDFKRPIKTLETIRALYDSDHHLRVLWICPMDGTNERDNQLVQIYSNLFTPYERERFTFLNPSANAPFVFSRSELANFYLSSKIYVHFANYETRCRTAAYAFCSGVPVVGHKVIANVLPDELVSEPTFFEVNDDDYVGTIVAALSDDRPTNRRECLKVLSETSSGDRLIRRLNEVLKPPIPYRLEDLYSRDLDVRLGAAHSGKNTNNEYASNLVAFVSYLCRRPLVLVGDVEPKICYPEHLVDSVLFRSTINREAQRERTYQVIQKFRRDELRVNRRGQLAYLLFVFLRKVVAVPVIGGLILRLFQKLRTLSSNS